MLPVSKKFVLVSFLVLEFIRTVFVTVIPFLISSLVVLSEPFRDDRPWPSPLPSSLVPPPPLTRAIWKVFGCWYSLGFAFFDSENPPGKLLLGVASLLSTEIT